MLSEAFGVFSDFSASYACIFRAVYACGTVGRFEDSPKILDYYILK